MVIALLGRRGIGRTRTSTGLLGRVVLHLEGERGDPDSGQRDTATLYSAYLRGVDIADRLTDDEVEAIELAAVKAPREIEEPA